MRVKIVSTMTFILQSAVVVFEDPLTLNIDLFIFPEGHLFLYNLSSCFLPVSLSIHSQPSLLDYQLLPNFQMLELPQAQSLETSLTPHSP